MMPVTGGGGQARGWWILGVRGGGAPVSYFRGTETQAKDYVAGTNSYVAGGPYPSRADAVRAEAKGPGNGGGSRSSAPPSTGPVTAREIYQLLIAKGLSTNQAVGVIANMINESGLDPEADGVDTNGYRSYGLIEWNSKGYTNAGRLVTGDPQKDVRAQIDYLFSSTSGLSAGLQGATAADVAGNFAQHVEVCAECAPGQRQWTERRANAATVLAWVASGHWPRAAKDLRNVGQGLSGSVSTCLVKGPSIPFLGSSGCLLSAGQARAVAGAGLIVLSLPVGLVGAIVLAAFTFRRTGAGPAVARSAEVAGGAIAAIPGAEPAGLAVAAAGSAQARKSQAAQRERKQQKTQREQDRQERRARSAASEQRRSTPQRPARSASDREPTGA